MNTRTLTRTAAAGAATLALAVPAAALVASSAQAHTASRDVERHVACAGGHLELSVDREGSGWEVDASVDHVKAGQQWRFVLKHDGTQIFEGTPTTDHEGDADVDRYRQDGSGKDAFWVKAVRLSDGTTCKAGVTVG